MLTIGIKEFLVIAGIVAFMIWIRMFRESMEKTTSTFMLKLKGPKSGGGGFGWRGLLLAFVVGIAACAGLILLILRLWQFYSN